MSRADRIALLLSLLAVLVSIWIAGSVFEFMAHLEDEMAYVWQAQAIAGGQLTVPSPVEPKSFLVPFVIDYQGQRFGKYPLGWPALLAIGVRLGVRWLVNPLLAGLGVWLTYRLGKRTYGEPVGLLAAGLTLSSPFFLINSGSLLSHPLGLVLSAAFALAWLDAFVEPLSGRPWLPTLVAALSLALLALTRPMTAAAVAFPFGLHGLYVFWRGGRAASPGGLPLLQVRRRLFALGLIVLLLGSLHFVWQYAVTGDPLLNPYTLWWDYDRVGFGPGHGRSPEGHTLHQAWINTVASLKYSGYADLYGWIPYSGYLVGFVLVVGLGATLVNLYPRGEAGGFSLRLGRRVLCLQPNRPALLLSTVFISLFLAYMAYWVGASLFGPRYYYEGLFSVTLLSSAGIAFLAGWPTRPDEPWHFYSGWRKARPLLVIALLFLLLLANLIYFMPSRLDEMRGLYGVNRANLQPFLSPQAQELTPALVIVHPTKKWIEYGTLLELTDPFLNTPFIFVHSRGVERDQNVIRSFPDRNVLHYYPDTPDRLYTDVRPQP